MSRRDEERRWLLGRRRLIQLGVATGAALGLPQWKVFEALGATGGNALADDAACAVTNRSVHIVAGTGGFAWFQLLWPQVDVAVAAGSGGGDGVCALPRSLGSGRELCEKWTDYYDLTTVKVKGEEKPGVTVRYMGSRYHGIGPC